MLGTQCYSSKGNDALLDEYLTISQVEGKLTESSQQLMVRIKLLVSENIIIK